MATLPASFFDLIKKYPHKFSRAVLMGSILLFSCSQSSKEKTSDSSFKTIDSQSFDNNSLQKMTDEKILGERFTVTGDFNGDKTNDTIFESYISSATQKETYKFLDANDWDHNQALIIDNKPISRIYSNIAGIDTFVVTMQSQQMGIERIENLGDLNGDGNDELGYVIAWADNSNLNHYHIISLAGKKFEEIFSFQINEAINFDPDELFDKTMIVKSIDRNRIQYRFYTDSATVETGEHEFVGD